MKHILWAALVLSLLVSACSNQGTAPAAEASPISQATPTQEAIQPVTPEPGMVASEPGCTVVSPIPTPGPTVQAMFPAPTESDWSRGPLTAAVTIIEYSDFQ